MDGIHKSDQNYQQQLANRIDRGQGYNEALNSSLAKSSLTKPVGITTLPARFGTGETCERIDFVQNITKSPAEHSMAKQDDSNLGKLASLGLEIGVGAALGAVIGIWVDRKLHSDPWG